MDETPTSCQGWHFLMQYKMFRDKSETPFLSFFLFFILVFLLFSSHLPCSINENFQRLNPTWTYSSEAPGWVFYQDSLPSETERTKPTMNLKINKVSSRLTLRCFQRNKFCLKNTSFQNKHFKRKCLFWVGWQKKEKEFHQIYSFGFEFSVDVLTFKDYGCIFQAPDFFFLLLLPQKRCYSFHSKF